MDQVHSARRDICGVFETVGHPSSEELAFSRCTNTVSISVLPANHTILQQPIAWCRKEPALSGATLPTTKQQPWLTVLYHHTCSVAHHPPHNPLCRLV